MSWWKRMTKGFKHAMKGNWSKTFVGKSGKKIAKGFENAAKGKWGNTFVGKNINTIAPLVDSLAPGLGQGLKMGINVHKAATGHGQLDINSLNQLTGTSGLDLSKYSQIISDKSQPLHTLLSNVNISGTQKQALFNVLQSARNVNIAPQQLQTMLNSQDINLSSNVTGTPVYRAVGKDNCPDISMHLPQGEQEKEVLAAMTNVIKANSVIQKVSTPNFQVINGGNQL